MSLERGLKLQRSPPWYLCYHGARKTLTTPPTEFGNRRVAGLTRHKQGMKYSRNKIKFIFYLRCIIHFFPKIFKFIFYVFRIQASMDLLEASDSDPAEMIM